MNILYKSEIYINFVRLLSNYNFVFIYCDICNVNEYVISLLFLYQINYLLLKDNIQFKRKLVNEPIGFLLLRLKNRKYLKYFINKIIYISNNLFIISSMYYSILVLEILRFVTHLKVSNSK